MTLDAHILKLLRRVKRPIRVPTACWLASDVLSILDCEARFAIASLIQRGQLVLSSGGWLNLPRKT